MKNVAARRGEPRFNLISLRTYPEAAMCCWSQGPRHWPRAWQRECLVRQLSAWVLISRAFFSDAPLWVAFNERQGPKWRTCA